jgi:hypothetical protein
MMENWSREHTRPASVEPQPQPYRAGEAPPAPRPPSHRQAPRRPATARSTTGSTSSASPRATRALGAHVGIPDYLKVVGGRLGNVDAVKGCVNEVATAATADHARAAPERAPQTPSSARPPSSWAGRREEPAHRPPPPPPRRHTPGPPPGPAPLPIKFQVLQTALGHFDASSTGTIAHAELSQAIESFKLGLPHDRVLRIAAKHTTADGRVRYAPFVRSLHANEPYNGQYHLSSSKETESATSVHGHHGHMHHHSQPCVGPLPSHYHMPLDLVLTNRPREHPARSAAAAAAAAVDHSRNPAFVPSSVPKIHEQLP